MVAKNLLTCSDCTLDTWRGVAIRQRKATLHVGSRRKHGVTKTWPWVKSNGATFGVGAPCFLEPTLPGASKTDENVIPTKNVFWENTMFSGNTAFSISSIFPYIPSTRHPFSKDLKSIISTSESPIALPFCARNEISFAFATRLSQLQSERRRPGTQIVKSTTVLWHSSSSNATMRACWLRTARKLKQRPCFCSRLRCFPATFSN